MSDPVHHPSHYKAHPSRLECIALTRHLSFCLGNATKYLWRAGLKDGQPSDIDLKKAAWYLRDEAAECRNPAGVHIGPQARKVAALVAAHERKDTPLYTLLAAMAWHRVPLATLTELADRLDPKAVQP